jgi:F-type H+-transporting ATPase subunit b
MLPDLSALWVIGLVLILSLIMNRLIFRPLLSAIAQREQAAQTARTLAEQAAAEARRATAEFDDKTTAARAEVYRQMDDMRRLAMDERTALIEATRADAEQTLAQARAQLDRDVADARARLDAEADQLAGDAAARILGRRAS